VWRESRIEEVDAMKHKHFTVSCDIDMYPVWYHTHPIPAPTKHFCQHYAYLDGLVSDKAVISRFISS
jgi:hypothetical protein